MKFARGVISTSLSLILILNPLPANASPLYSFSTHTFTNCGQTGRNGPSLSACKSSYSNASWRNNTDFFNVTNGIAFWKAPSTGLYQITAAGAAGVGANTAAGLGAIIQATVTLTKGSVYKILVGQAGSNGTGGSGGGGGGTFLTDSSNTPIIVAGGGGGATNEIGSATTANGQTTNNGSNNSDGTISGGTNGNGGNGGIYTAGGGGLTGNGLGGSNASSYGGSGTSFTNGGTGGNTANTAFGGFGGGGGTHGNTGGGGGGGGYSGGAAGPNYTLRYNGGGGGSFVIAGASNISTSNGLYAGSSVGNLGQYNGTYLSSTIPHGYLTITNLNSVSISVDSVSGSRVATFRTAFQLRATLGEAGGKVAFYQQGKIIPTCKQIITSTTTAICNWLPSAHASTVITAILTPNSDTMGSTSAPVIFSVVRRTNPR